MPKVIICKGLPASGKTTWALEQVRANPNKVKRVNKDDLRDLLHGGWSKANERFIIGARDRMIMHALDNGAATVIIDDTNLVPIHEQHIRQLVQGRAEVEIKDFTDVSLETCLERNELRLGKVPDSSRIRQMWWDHLRPKSVEQDKDLPKAIICDVDGTLANNSGKRNPYDASRAMEDELNAPVHLVLKALSNSHTIIITSGRKEEHRQVTADWLAANYVPYDFLYLRQDDDGRHDHVVKEELFFQHIHQRYYVDFVFDDRDQVVDLWRRLGLHCFQVNYGNF